MLKQLSDFLDELDAMTKLTGVYAIVCLVLSVLGWVLAFTVDPGAINMGLGAALGVIIFGGMFFAMAHIDRMW